MKRNLNRSNIAASHVSRESPVNAPTQCPASSRGTVVVAEDDVATLQLLCQVLKRAAFTVYAVENGELACEAVRLRQPDVILLDWMMPVMDGLRAAELLKADVATRAIPIVMITTHSQIEDRHLALKAGVQDFVTKPFDAAELVGCVEQQMRWRTIIVSARAGGRRSPVSDRASAASSPHSPA